MSLPEILFLIMALLTVAMIAAGFERHLPVPYTVLLVILGLMLSLLADHVALFESLNEAHLTPDLVLFVFLPALVFESAFNLDARRLMKDLLPVLTLAVPALLLATLIVGLGVNWLLGIPLLVALLFGALISATDPVAVVALFRELGAPQRLTVLVEGESLFNDATAIVLFHILLGLALSGNVQWTDGISAVFSFLWVFFGGVLVGLSFGLLLSELMSRLPLSGSGQIILSLVMAYTSFLLAEHYLHVSGVMAVVASALTLGYFGVTRLSFHHVGLLRETWEFLALVFNSLLFLLVGLSVDATAFVSHLDSILIAAALVLLSRALVLYPLVPLTTRLFQLPPVSLRERHIMWWGGLKGGLAIAIVLSIPFELGEREQLVYLTLGVVVCSLLVNASTIRPLMAWLGLSALNADERVELERGLARSRGNITTLLDRFQSTGLLSQPVAESIHAHYPAYLDSNHAQQPLPQADERQAFLDALRLEFDELDELNEIGLLPAYTYLDLRNTLQRDREYWAAWQPGDAQTPSGQGVTLFERVEKALLRVLREQDWTSGFLSRYQSLRLTYRLQHDVASVLMCTEVIKALYAVREREGGAYDRVIEIYRQRLQRRQERLSEVREEFPLFFRRFETRLFAAAALTYAERQLHRQIHRGEIGAKASKRIEDRLEHALQELPPTVPAVRALKPTELIRSVPLFNEVSVPVLEKLAGQAVQVTFLQNDVIIAEGERGDALYILTRGRVQVSRSDNAGNSTDIAQLEAGAFFGETAMLGDQVRTATVTALTPVSLLRLRHRDVRQLMADDAEVARQLQYAFDQRRGPGKGMNQDAH